MTIAGGKLETRTSSRWAHALGHSLSWGSLSARADGGAVSSDGLSRRACLWLVQAERRKGRVRWGTPKGGIVDRGRVEVVLTPKGGVAYTLKGGVASTPKGGVVDRGRVVVVVLEVHCNDGECEG